MGAFTPNAGLFPRPPEQQDYVSQYAHLAQLRQLMGMAPLQQEQLRQENQARALQNQQMQQSIADQNQIRDAMKQNPNATFGDLLPTLRGKVMPNTLLELQKADLQMQQTLAQKDDVQIKAFQAQHDAYQGIYNSAQRMSDSS